MERQAVRGLAPNIEHFYVACGPRKARLQHDRSPVQTTVIAREPVPPSLPADDDRGRLQATV
jgi:hypothetical protein